MENLAGFIASGLIGISLGLIGGGGSIITIPVLVYLFHIQPTLATAYSLFIVGSTSLVGGVQSAFNKTVDTRSALMLALPSTTGVYLTRHFILPHIPDAIRITKAFTITRDTGLMLFFAGIMIIASLRMIRNKKLEDKSSFNHRYPFIVLLGFSIGVITGIVGAGGGFLIIPALVLFLGLPMKRALGTSLIVIAINSLIGFFGDWSLVKEIDFNFLSRVSMLAVAGVFFGTYLTRFIDGEKLKSGFGWFALTVALIIIGKEMMI
jgi:uncharacterized membrane protein YfcA